MSPLSIQNNNTPQKIAFVLTSLVMCAAVIASFSSIVFAANADAETALVRTMNSAHIKGIENVPNISVGKFLNNFCKNTGIYRLVCTAASAVYAPESVFADPFLGIVFPGWQKLIMIAFGIFLFMYAKNSNGAGVTARQLRSECLLQQIPFRGENYELDYTTMYYNQFDWLYQE